MLAGAYPSPAPGLPVTGFGATSTPLDHPRRPRPRRLQPLFDGQPDPTAEVAGLHPRRAIPGDSHRIQEPPPQQIHPYERSVAADRPIACSSRRKMDTGSTTRPAR